MTVAEPCVYTLGMAHSSTVDGPGRRFVVFFQGCPLRCSWCHSPHSWPKISPLLFFETRCTLCGRCGEACGQGVHLFENGVHHIDRSRCVQCGQCAAACPQSAPGKDSSALKLPGRAWNVELLYAHIKPYLQLCDGVTLSGGEALAQSRGATALLKLLKAGGVHTAVETSGLLAPAVYESVLPLVDAWLIGIRVVTGQGRETDTERLVQNGLLFKGGGAVYPRIPMVPGVMDEPGVLARIHEVLTKLGLRQIALSPWNRDYRHYYAASGTEPGLAAPTPGEIAETEARMKTFFEQNHYYFT